MGTPACSRSSLLFSLCTYAVVPRHAAMTHVQQTQIMPSFCRRQVRSARLTYSWLDIFPVEHHVKLCVWCVISGHTPVNECCCNFDKRRSCPVYPRENAHINGMTPCTEHKRSSIVQSSPTQQRYTAIDGSTQPSAHRHTPHKRKRRPLRFFVCLNQICDNCREIATNSFGDFMRRDQSVFLFWPQLSGHGGGPETT